MPSMQLQWGSWQIGGPRHYHRENLILKAIRSLPIGVRILDVGCGTGSLMIQLALRGYHVNGIDASEECIRQTQERLKHYVPDTPSAIKKGSAERIDYPDKTFDVVIAAEVLEHLEKDRLAVKEFHRLLKPGGICLITVPANPGLWDISDEMAGHKRRYSKEQVLALFNNSSFHVERLFFIGFPLMRLYNRLVFQKWAMHVDKRGDRSVSSKDIATRIGLNWWTTFILGNIFRIDNLFGSLPWGIGILLIAKRN